MENFNEYRYKKAKEKVNAIKGFYGNLIAYIFVIPMLFWLNYKTTSFLWAIFPAVGWGLGLLLQGLCVYGLNPLFGKDWEERKINEFMQKERL